jgi:hypothetical protein
MITIEATGDPMTVPPSRGSGGGSRPGVHRRAPKKRSVDDESEAPSSLDDRLANVLAALPPERTFSMRAPPPATTAAQVSEAPTVPLLPASLAPPVLPSAAAAPIGPNQATEPLVKSYETSLMTDKSAPNHTLTLDKQATPELLLDKGAAPLTGFAAVPGMGAMSSPLPDLSLNKPENVPIFTPTVPSAASLDALEAKVSPAAAAAAAVASLASNTQNSVRPPTVPISTLDQSPILSGLAHGASDLPALH